MEGAGLDRGVLAVMVVLANMLLVPTECAAEKLGSSVMACFITRFNEFCLVE